MVIAAILINQSGKPAGSPSTSREDLDLNTLVTLTNDDNSGITSWLWEFVYKPPTSSAVISGAGTSTATFTPDVVGSYLIKLTVSDGVSDVIDQRIAAIKTSQYEMRIPAAEETVEFDGTTGWASAIYNAFTNLDANANKSGDPVKIDQQIALPTYGDGYGWMYSTILDGYTELFYRDSYGNSVQISDKGILYGGGLLGAAQLSELADVSTSTPTSGNLLIPNGLKWYSRTLGGAIAIDSYGNTSFIATAETVADDNDLIVIYDNTASAYRRMTRANFVSGVANTLDRAYDEGGAGVGRTITADSGAVKITLPDGATDHALHIENNDVTNFKNSLYLDGAAGGTIIGDGNLIISGTSSTSAVITTLLAQQTGTADATLILGSYAISGTSKTYVGYPSLGGQNIYVGYQDGAPGLTTNIITIGGGNSGATCVQIRGYDYGATNGFVTLQTESGPLTLMGGGDMRIYTADKMRIHFHETTGYLWMQHGNDTVLELAADGYVSITPLQDKNFNVNTTGNGKIDLDGYLLFNDGYRAEAGWTKEYIEFASSASDWTDYKANFGEVSLLGAIVQAIVGGNILLDDDSYITVTDTGNAADIDMVLNGESKFKIDETDGGVETITLQALGAGSSIGVSSQDNMTLTYNYTNSYYGTFYIKNNLFNMLAMDSYGSHTLYSQGSQPLSLSASSDLQFSDGNKSGSTWVSLYLKLSSAASEWNTYKTNFGEVSLFNALSQLVTGDVSQLSDLSDIGTSTATAGNLLIADGYNWDSVSVDGAITIDEYGATEFNSTIETTVDNSDLLVIYDNTASSYKRMTRGNFLNGVEMSHTRIDDGYFRVETVAGADAYGADGYVIIDGYLKFNDGYRAQSDWNQEYMRFSNSPDDWSDYKENFGETSLLDGLNQIANELDDTSIVDDTSFYVDGDSGNDSNDGSSWANAKKTLGFLTWGESDAIPRRIDATVTINVRGTIRFRAGTYGNLINGFYGSGNLIIQGELEEVQSFTITGYDNDVTNIDGRCYVDASGESWTPGDLVTKFMGPSATSSSLRPIADNTATRLIVPYVASLTGTPTYYIYQANNSFLNEFEDNPGVGVTCYVTSTSNSLFYVDNCSLSITCNNLDFSQVTKLAQTNPVINNAFDIEFNRCAMRNLNTYNRNTSVGISYSHITHPSASDWSSISNGSFVSLYRTAFTGNNLGYGMNVDRNGSTLLTWEVLVYQCVSGFIIEQGAQFYNTTDIMFSECADALVQQGGTVIFSPLALDQRGPKFKNCTTGWTMYGPVTMGITSQIISSGCTTDIKIGETETKSFSAINSQEPISNARTGTYILYPDTSGDYFPIPWNEYDNSDSGLTATNYKDAIDEIYSLEINADIDYYVDGDSGNDSNDGLSWGTAKKTLYFLNVDETGAIPRIINATVNVYVRGTIRFPSSDGNLINHFKGNGEINIIGFLQAETTFTLNSYDNNMSNIDGGMYYEDTGASWTPGEWDGYWVGSSDTSDNNHFRPIANSTATKLTIPRYTGNITGTPTYTIYGATNNFLNEVESSPGVKIEEEIINIRECTCRVYVRNVQMKNVDRSYCYPLVYRSTDVEFYRCNMRAFSLSSPNTYVEVKYCTIDLPPFSLFPAEGDWGGIYSKAYIYGAINAFVGYGLGQGVLLSGDNSLFRSWGNLFYECRQGIAVGASCHAKFVDESFFISCEQGIAQQGGSIELELYGFGLLRFKDCDTGWVCGGHIAASTYSAIIHSGCTVEIALGETETASFSDITSQVQLKNSANGTSCTYIDPMNFYLPNQTNEYDNYNSGLIATNYQDAIDEAFANETVANIDAYVDGSTGDDSNDGSVGSPYKTFRFLNKLPKTIKHKVHVHVAAGTYTYFPEVLDFNYEDEGKLILDASDETFPVEAGPYTVASISGVGGSGPYGVSLATDVNVTSPGWVADAYEDKFIHMTSGAASGSVFPIFKNTTTAIRTHANLMSLAGLDTFNIVDCPVVIDIDHRVRFVGNYQQGISVGNSIKTTHSPHQIHLFMVGISFDIDQADEDSAVFDSVHSFLNLFKVHDKYTTTDYSVAGSFINAKVNIDSFSSVLDNSDLETHYYVPGIQFVSDVNPADTYYEDIKTYNSSLGGVCCRRTIAAYGGSSNVIVLSMCGGVYLAGNDRLDLDYLFIEQIGFADKAIECKNSYLTISSCYVDSADIGMLIKDDSTCRAHWFQGDTMIDDYGTHIDFGSKMFIDPTNVTLAGSINDYRFLQRPSSESWPVAGAVATDNRGAFVVGDFGGTEGAGSIQWNGSNLGYYDGTSWNYSANIDHTHSKIEEGNSFIEVVDTGSDGYSMISVEGSEAARFDSYGLSVIEELKIKTYSQDAEPTLSENNRMAIWIDTNDGYRSYLLLRVNGSTRSVELT